MMEEALGRFGIDPIIAKETHMSVHLRHRRPVLISALMVITLFFAIVPVTGAQSPGNVDWFGWGVKVNFRNKTWKVDYVTYLGSNSPLGVVAEKHRDISAQCTPHGSKQLSYPSDDAAFFDGKVHLQCNLPSVRGELVNLGYTPPSGDQPFCICMLGGAPFWVDGQVKLTNSSGTMPFLDASDRGVRVNLLVNGAKARTKLEVTRAQPPGGFMTYTSPEWTIDPAGNRTLMGWDGPKIVAVANHFHWLDYLTDPGWEPFFMANVRNNKIGYWNEAPTQSGTSTLSSNYKVGMNGGTLYIGYSPSTGKYFKGEISEGGVDPGCDGT